MKALPHTATLSEVARRAGVSVGTASKALNGRPDVGEQTRARVVAVAKEMSFAPNVMARSLLSGRSESVGLLTSDLEGRFALPIMVGLEDALGEAATITLMTNSRGREDLERRHLKELLRRRVDGLVVIGERSEPREPLTGVDGVSIVYAYAPSRSEQDVSVVTDDRGNGRLAAEHLLSLGRTRIAHVPGPLRPEDVGHTAAAARLRGSTEALAERGISPVDGTPARGGEWSEQWGWDATHALLDRHDLDALVCGNDQIARGAIDKIHDRGLRVPQDLAVVGFDDWQKIAGPSRLPITTVDMNLGELGRQAASLVLKPHASLAGTICVPGRLIVRTSTASGPGA